MAFPPLRAFLDGGDAQPEVVLAACRALIALGDRDAVPGMLRQARTGSVELCEVIEPALAAWGRNEAGPLWLERLRDEKTTQRRLVLAMRGLAALREEGAVARLRDLVKSTETPASSSFAWWKRCRRISVRSFT